ncbi:putative chloroplast envelope membrane protein, CemA [Helianthus annuus]|nr:putative chloroplast envelope membrane protein, CemA [Helianthus annuus]KAJ0599597.1 putative chloroplast envelope membrane protein, CemA [Helianthus annuus]KAJ0607131.1 putative chloroplast envelope membrane protein, CemA [Helianthus annuus]KAJ0767185.1 putative chloroplast envelope membrane protein, CemA [Helianthus annuus]KAJ0773036.1 putative chloroplast envelope membrane protein, CemA [Helianthus annuus]
MSVIGLSGRGRRGFGRLVPNAKKKHTRKRTWWQKFFFDEDGNWLGLKDDEMLEVEEEAAKSGSDDEGLSENEKFEAWRRRAEALVELREAQENVQNEEERKWEDWLLDATNGGGGGGGNSNGNGSSWFQEPSDESVEGDSSDLIPGKGFTESVRDLVFGREDDEILYEDRVFRYASFNSAKFLAALIIIPWALDFFVHDYVLMPFLDRYVKTVPLAAEILDVRKHQKLEMVKELKTEKERYKFEVEIGKSPPISDEELYLELRHKALELRDEWRLINRSAFANIWSDMVFGISLFVLLYFNQNQVALLKFTGYKIINNISDTGKAFLIILITDIFLGYHSESGWQTLLEIIVDHYGFDVDHSAIIIFVCLIPVVIDACVKLWMFKFLPRLSPKVSNIFQEMKRH